MPTPILTIGNQELVKSSGDFKMDGLWITHLEYDAPATNDASQKQTLVIDLIPFAYLDDNDKIFYEKGKKQVRLSDAQAHMDQEALGNIGNMEVLQAFLACLKAGGALADQQGTNWQTVFTSPF